MNKQKHVCRTKSQIRKQRNFKQWYQVLKELKAQTRISNQEWFKNYYQELAATIVFLRTSSINQKRKVQPGSNALLVSSLK